MTKIISDEELIRLYAEPGRGYTDQELGDRFGVGREAIFKRRTKSLALEYPFKPTERGRWRIDTEKLTSHIRVSLKQALALYLPARRVSRSTPLPKGVVREALSKLAPTLYKPMTEKLVEAAANAPEHTNEARREQILDDLMQAWSEKRAIRLKYLALDRAEANWHEVSPYLIEPSPWSDSIYVVSYSATSETIIPFSLERIEKTMLTSAPFKECNLETEEKLLQYAWGIWRSDRQPERVTLRFTGRRAVRRLRESQWHPEEIVDGPDDYSYAIWQAPIADWREMLPWIRGWGESCEVLESEGLREEIKVHVWKLARTYRLSTHATDLDSRLLRLWGKTTEDAERFHPALFHMFDVAHVAQQLLSPRTSSRWRRVLADALNVEADTLHEWLPYLVALHDIGKISVPFQILNDKQQSRLIKEGFDLGNTFPKAGRELHHSIVGRLVSDEIVEDWSDNLKAVFLEMLSGHHGVFQAESRDQRRNFKRIREVEEWVQLRRRAVRILQSYFLQQWPDPLPNPAHQSAAMMVLNGFCILCDWLGSDSKEGYFTPNTHTPLIEYIPLSRRRAYKRVKDAGFFQKATSTAPTQFAGLFPNIGQPRPLQRAIDAIPEALLSRSTLTIIEGPAGEGKTETALALARRIAALCGTDEMYIALPTTATSNAMFDRVQEHLQKRLGLSPELVNLVHGQAFLKEDDLPLEPMRSVELEGETESPSLEWFGPKKKALLAPFGVGTIDQAELAALNVRHNALRMIGLAGKTIILDEVHAYDTYMTTIIKRMLTWLSALGSSVILLSATLPMKRRAELAEAFAARK